MTTDTGTPTERAAEALRKQEAQRQADQDWRNRRAAREAGRAQDWETLTQEQTEPPSQGTADRERQLATDEDAPGLGRWRRQVVCRLGWIAGGLWFIILGSLLALAFTLPDLLGQ